MHGSGVRQTHLWSVKFTIPTSIFSSLSYLASKNAIRDCIGGIVGNDGLVNSIGGAWLVGDIFLQSVYTNFDLANNRVGFAQPR